MSDEVRSLASLYDAIRSSAAGLADGWELVFVDDGNGDGSSEVMCELAESGSGRVTTVILRGRFGNLAALAAGFRAARGEMIITSRASWSS